jgi:hypothetical protein
MTGDGDTPILDALASEMWHNKRISYAVAHRVFDGSYPEPVQRVAAVTPTVRGA